MDAADDGFWWGDDPAALEAELSWLDFIPAELVTEPGDEAWAPLSVPELIEAARRCPVGPERVRLLAELADGRSLTDEQWLSVVELWQPCQAWTAGLETAAVAGFAGPAPGPGLDSPRDQLEANALRLELAAALGCSKERAAAQIELARRFTTVLAATHAQVCSGVLSPYRGWVIADELAGCDDALARQVETLVLPRAAQVSVPALKRRIRKALVEARPEQALDELVEGVRERGVVLDTEIGGGQMQLAAYLPPVEGLAVHAKLEAIAGRFDPTDGRTKDQRMADALVGCVLGFRPDKPGFPVKPDVQVPVLVDLNTLLRLREHAADLTGFGPIPADVARELAADAAWQRWVFDPVDGHLIDQGDTAYPPKPRLDRYVRGRDRYCRFPFSDRSVLSSDLDHTIPFGDGGKDGRGRARRGGPSAGGTPACRRDERTSAGTTVRGPAIELPADADAGAPADSGDRASGPAVDPSVDRGRAAEGAAPTSGGRTSADNLAALSRTPHRAKTHSGFELRQLGNGILEWRTPMGRRYVTRPHDYRPDNDGDPPD